MARKIDSEDCFFMWQVQPSVIFGRNQLIESEVNLEYCREHGIRTFRRKSGGGCVYADMSNVMFSYITKDKSVNFTFNKYINMVVMVLQRLGVDAKASGRNDIMIGDRKVSGNAFYHVPDRSIVHAIIEVYGPESSGKTTLALHILAEAQKQGGEVAFIDVEHALDPTYAEALGVDINNLLVSQPDTGEQAMEICEALVRSGAIDAIVVDSVAAMVPRAEIEGEMGDSHVGLQARLMSQAMRKLTSVIGKTNTVCVFINQLREKVGVMYGNPEVTTGGRALKYYASVRIDIRRVEGLKDSSGQFIGNHTRAKIVKNKVAPPFREAEFDIMFGEGISKMSELIDVGVKLGIVQKSGAWFNYGDVRLGQGRDNAKQFLKDNPEIANDIEGQIRANADKLYASRRPAGKGAAAKAEEPAKAADAKEPVVKAPARSSESELDIMVED